MARSPEQFGKALRRMREAAGLTQEILAEHAGLSARGISDIERGVIQTPRLETVRMLADSLGLDNEQSAELIALRNTATRPQTAAAHSNAATLPIPVSSFIGRVQEVESISAILRRHNVRLLTLTGPGGVGKTRLSIEVARQLQGFFSHGVAFIDLAPIRSPEMVLPTIASQLGLREQPGTTLKSVLQLALQDRSMLLVLDNLEQVSGAASDIAGLLAACPSLNILATSRVVLRIGAEHVFEIEPMQVSNEAAMQKGDAVLLFEERVQAANNQFMLNDVNVDTVIELVDRLQGMPLAIELAAARTRLWPVAELLGKLDAQLPFLGGGAVDAPQRHRSLRDTIGWSYELLTPRDKAVFRTMSIFPVGCTMETAIAVLGDNQLSAADQVTEAIGTLVDSSLVRPHDGVDHRVRYRMLASVREFGLEQLEVSGEDDKVRWAAHRAWAEPLALQAELAPFGLGATEHARFMDAEHQNFNEHIDWLVHHDEVLPALNLYGLLSLYRWVRGSNENARRSMEKLLADPRAQAPTLERLRGLVGLMSDYESADDYRQARFYLDAAEDLARELKNLNSLLRVFTAQANNRAFSGDFGSAEHYFDEINALATQHGWQWASALELYLRGFVCYQRGDLNTAFQLTSKARDIAHAAGSAFTESRAKAEIGLYLMLLNRLDEAEDTMLQAHRQFKEMGDSQALPISLTDLSELALLRGDTAQARERAERGLEIARKSGSMNGIGQTSRALARIAIAEEDWSAARRLLPEAMHWFERSNDQGFAVDCLEEYAEIELASGSPAFSAWCLGAVDARLESGRTTRAGILRDKYEDLKARVQSALSPEEWSDNHSAAGQLTLEQVLAEVRSRNPL